MKYCILGASRSGLAAARLACTINKNSISNCDIVKSNNSVFVRELGDVDSFADAVNEFNILGVEYEFGKNSQTLEKAQATLSNFDFLIISPGIPTDAPFVQYAEQIGIPIISELEFGFQNVTNPIIAVTGTNGKTTTTTLITYILNNCGKQAISAGNIGTPLSDVANDIISGKYNDELIIVAEVSSYQLQFIDRFRPKVAIILNVTPDHLKYHKTFENYLNTKYKIAKNQTTDDILILNADDDAINCKSDETSINQFRQRTNIKSTIEHFSLSPVERGIYLFGDKIINNLQQKKEEIMLANQIRIPGVHNQYNSMASAIAANVWQINNEDLRDCLMKFQGVEHRLEYVQTINGVDYINDSKATNVNATWYALSSYTKPLIWIAGGRGDNNDYSTLDVFVKKNVVKIIAFGEEKFAIYDRYADMIDCQKVETLCDAVELAHDVARTGEIVLFSPACKSFDQFLNYEQRGEVFKQAVNQIGAILN